MWIWILVGYDRWKFDAGIVEFQNTFQIICTPRDVGMNLVIAQRAFCYAYRFSRAQVSWNLILIYPNVSSKNNRVVRDPIFSLKLSQVHWK